MIYRQVGCPKDFDKISKYNFNSCNVLSSIAIFATLISWTRLRIFEEMKMNLTAPTKVVCFFHVEVTCIPRSQMHYLLRSISKMRRWRCRILMNCDIIPLQVLSRSELSSAARDKWITCLPSLTAHLQYPGPSLGRRCRVRVCSPRRPPRRSRTSPCRA